MGKEDRFITKVLLQSAGTIVASLWALAILVNEWLCTAERGFCGYGPASFVTGLVIAVAVVIWGAMRISLYRDDESR